MPRNEHETEKARRSGKTAGGGASPEWADGLRHLYDSVVEEPLPDSFKDLLAQLDETDDDDLPSKEGKKD
ncbi:NepR family anti-sigma factor [Erythrobacter rubeus]|uniref:Anti-sigma factor NepR domain-containing protein n=1 Tax=Erythrobacter rubeus TaxID=2760803 RepID=A0ABR8KKM7_9SPHN|nr:NepR family anti-sigma factor [Erythrobacter rubeus]MBD2840790.1 hypothetical protein [Erythrobacter rubeus]